MKDLFQEIVRVDKNRSIVVEELPCGGYAIRGTTYDEYTGKLGTAAIRFSPEATEALTGILNRLIEARKEEKTNEQ